MGIYGVDQRGGAGTHLRRKGDIARPRREDVFDRKSRGMSDKRLRAAGEWRVVMVCLVHERRGQS